MAAIYYAFLARNQTELERVWTITSLIVAVSIVLHGITATPFVRRLARHKSI